MRIEDSVYIVLWVGHVFIGLLIIILSIPLALQRIKMNRWYGVRLAKSYESDEHWYAINRLWSRRAMFWSVAFIVLSGIAAYYLYVLSENSVSLTLIYACSPLILVVLLILEALHCSKKLP